MHQACRNLKVIGIYGECIRENMLERQKFWVQNCSAMPVCKTDRCGHRPQSTSAQQPIQNGREKWKVIGIYGECVGENMLERQKLWVQSCSTMPVCKTDRCGHRPQITPARQPIQNGREKWKGNVYMVNALGRTCLKDRNSGFKAAQQCRFAKQTGVGTDHRSHRHSSQYRMAARNGRAMYIW